MLQATATPRTVMVATVGGQPQVVTFALDALLDQGVPVHTVYLLHLSLRNPRYAAALGKLVDEWDRNGTLYRARNHPCRLQRVPLGEAGHVLDDIRSQEDSQVVRRTVQRLLVDLKREGATVHLCVTGGRRMIGLLAVTAAALLMDHRDRVWHLYTPDAVRAQAAEGRRMHVTPAEGVRLVPVPLIPWSEYFPGLRALALADEQAVDRHLRHLADLDERRCQEVYEQLTPRQREVLEAFAQGLRPQEVAERLSISLHTVHSHKKAILDACRQVWGVTSQGDPRLDYHFLREQFGPFFAHQRAHSTMPPGSEDRHTW